MALAAAGSRLALLAALHLLLFLSAHAGLSLDRSDLRSLADVQAALGIITAGERNSSSTAAAAPCPCSSHGVVCERRLSSGGDGGAYVLRVTRLVLKSRRLQGSLSPAIGRLAELKELTLADNELVDGVPSRIADCKKLEILDLRNNRFSGEVPAELSSLVRLRVIDLSSNEFAGDLSFLKNFPNLEILALSGNLFAGKIPASVRSFRNLRVFDVSGNDFLEGPVPVLEGVDVELPDSGIPRRYVLAENSLPPSTRRNASASASAFAKAPASQSPSPSGTGQEPHKKNKRKSGRLVLGFVVGALAGSVSGFVFSLLFKLITAAIRGAGKKQSFVLFSSQIKRPEDLAFLEKDDGLAELEIIGSGGCGEVYKAQLPSDGMVIAIKKIIQPPQDTTELNEDDSKALNKKMRQIQSEIRTVGQIRHRNLLPLLAHVPRPNCHYLVYEFMKNGSLQDVLTQVSQGSRELAWPARHRIAIGIASGLEYLHMDHSRRIIHRDLKPANVLLDDDMEARIADFGLAKAMPDAKTHITTSNVAGTVGYIAPEYHQTLKFTDKCDVYSFGVLLGVLVMGKIPSDEFFQRTPEIGPVNWLRKVMTSDNPSEAVDPKLIGNGYEEQMLLVLKIACFCTLDDPKQRPNSKDVRCMLSQIKM
ncbi:leucine-rich repeat receptor-like serine/threonine/tyrosine-protein kinase SOBIR1 [Eucalyptus grandis]|uniref:leucine-rich repeat receptor-like serine/threonine/tyrosine-protein kinase SOBIR1 n=1 Tax=Eucalyptus grandis TaxID=71139 RepID=UPI00192EE638|nr:leucine-rich repeat receptor-like serine/threonine/tyrosine-protein kinase SOBIR1 [Eucalyptus grandis]